MSTQNITNDDILRRSKSVSIILDDIENKIVSTIETVRVSYGYSLKQFSELMGMSYDQYYRKLNRSTKKYVTGKKALPFSASDLIRFCYIFGYDLETVVSNDSAPLFSSEQALLEFAMQIASLNDAALQEISDTISNSANLGKEQKRMSTIAIREFVKYRDEVKNSAVSEGEPRGA